MLWYLIYVVYAILVYYTLSMLVYETEFNFYDKCALVFARLLVSIIWPITLPTIFIITKFGKDE